MITDTILEAVSCPLCGGASYDVLFPAAYPDSLTSGELLRVYSSSSEQRLMDQLVRCRSCSMSYLNPRVKSEIILNSYRDAQDVTHWEQSAPRIATFKRSLLWLFHRLGMQPSSDLRILDIGSAGGYFLRAAADLGCSPTGIEPSVWLSEAGRKEFKVDLRTGTLADHSFDSGSFSMVTLWDVLEHVIDPGDVLDQIRPLLKNDGALVINYPDYGSLVSRMLGKRWPFLLSVHLHYFTRHTITRLLKEHGFRARFFKPYFQTLETGYVLQRAAAVLPWISPLQSLVKGFRLDRLPLRYHVGQTLLAAEKA
jgi:2-polyprenyl-3-methyl-5-hydroxy-6-metoxy-1,4-benzoquinol methylase